VHFSKHKQARWGSAMSKKAKSDQSRALFYDQVLSTPLAARDFFEGIERHFSMREGTVAYFIGERHADMRLRLGDGSEPSTPPNSVFAALEWRPQDQIVYCRCMLDQKQLRSMGFNGRLEPTRDDEPQLSQMWLSQRYWSKQSVRFIELLEAAERQLIEQNGN
jgi:hypothetical protein